jgi:dienelactone hydrolase
MLDSYAIMEYAMSYSRDNNNANIYVLGRSLGGAVSVNLATQ